MKKMLRLMKNQKFIGLTILVFLCLCGYNVWQSAVNFFSLNIFQVINILITIFVAYVLVQYKNDERKRKEIAEKLSGEIQGTCNDIVLLLEVDRPIRVTTWQNMLMTKRTLKNKIGYLEKICEDFDCVLLFESLSGYLVAIENLFGTIGPDQLINVELWSELKKNLVLVEDKCSELIVNLYKT